MPEVHNNHPMNFQYAIDVAKARYGKETMVEFCERVGVSRAQLGKIRNGDCYPSVTFMKRIASESGMKAWELLKLAEEGPKRGTVDD